MKVLVPIDDTDLSHSAIPVAARMVREAGGELLLVSIGELPETSRHEAEEASALQRRLAEAASRIEGVPVHTRVELAGDPAAGVLQVAAEEHTDRIVMASSGAGRFEALVEGSVAEDVEEDARVPVTVVSPDNDA